ncbi:MAG: HAMP domain-containing histidine kinase [Vicinamibacteria bacterium]|nr:HAMP domain-containing histidine kinase [Vicinamibacteria bacterium]
MASRAVSLVDLAAHELRTPLTVAIGSLRQLAGLADPVHQAAVARAVRSCERLERLATEMRDWTRLAESPPAACPVALAGVLTEAMRTASAIRADEVTIIVGGTPDVMVQALPHVPGALAALLVAVVRAAEGGETIAVEATVANDAATVVARRPGAGSFDGGATFDAEWLGGLGFSLPLARAVITGSGGEVTSAHSADGRLQAVSVQLAVARPQPSR